MNCCCILNVALFIIIIKSNKHFFIFSKAHNDNIYFTSRSYYNMWYYLASQIVEKNSRISISRYGDGEYLIMTGKAQEGIDHFGYKGGKCRLREELYNALKCPTNGNCYYGVWYNNLSDFLKWSNQHPQYITTSNIFSNNNYPKTKLLLKSLIHDENEEIILFCNEEAKNTSFAKHVNYFPKYIVSYYNKYYSQIIKNATLLAKKYRNHLFILSIGPLSPVLIYHMRKANVYNRYIDFGSTMDELIKGHTNRDYANPNTQSAKLVEKAFTIFINGTIMLS